MQNGKIVEGPVEDVLSHPTAYTERLVRAASR